MRGKLTRQRVVAEAFRITPADAGKTCIKNESGRTQEDHPRGCGENRRKRLKEVVDAGSPPRMRGKLSVDKAALKKARITPADAGKTIRNRNRSRNRRDHPRGCGENLLTVDVFDKFIGSPPRMRGKRQPRFPCSAAYGITPADAGKTVDALNKYMQAADHPRGCGENPCFRTARKRKLGSPPRMRGKLHGEQWAGMEDRITPADAGKTAKTLDRTAERWDHPRGCGENLNQKKSCRGLKGSPPRMRGKLFLWTTTSLLPRITPADAGKTRLFGRAAEIY